MILQIADDFKTLLNKAPELLDWGVIRWRGAVRRSLRLRDDQALDRDALRREWLLIDYNERKLVDASEVWGDVAFLNPYWLRPTRIERILLWISLFFWGNASMTLRALAIAITVKKRVSKDAKRVAWNPYSVFHHAIIRLCDVHETYILSPKYPLPESKTSFVGHRVLQEIYSLENSQFRSRQQGIEIASADQRVAFYFTKLCERDPREERLKDFALYLLRRSVPIVIYLHYVDRDGSEVQGLNPELVPSVRRAKSIEDISSQQISVSGASTIGLELLSHDLAHFVCFGEAGDQSSIPFSFDSTPFRCWIKDHPHGLRRSLPNNDWVEQILRTEPVRGQWLRDVLMRG
jgi:hypothetical protein